MFREDFKFLLPLCGLPCAAAPALAAGGHHAVDDAAILDPGQCQFESWIERRSGARSWLAHVSPSCRVGPIELGAGFERLQVTGDASDEPSDTARNLQVKWATPISEQWSVGLLLDASWSGHPVRHAATTLLVPLSWQASEAVALHLNLGHDFGRNGDDVARTGAAIEIAPSERWMFIAEHFREGHATHHRAGLRWTPQPHLNIDLSHTRWRAPHTPHLHSAWTLGLTRVFGRTGD